MKIEPGKDLAQKYYEDVVLNKPLKDELATLRAENSRLIKALEWYASDEAWTVYQTEGPDGDYGQLARAALEGT
jgi:hypothetical protein